MTEETKKKLSDARTAAKIARDSQSGDKKVVDNSEETEEGKYVSKEEFTAFSKEMTSSLNTLVDLIKNKEDNKEKVSAQVKTDEEPEQPHVPPKWREMVDRILGKDFGMSVVYPDNGKGFYFKLIVPKEKSNASESHMAFYKADIRTKSIAFSDGIEGIKQYCEKVARHLKMDPRQNERNYDLGLNK